MKVGDTVWLTPDYNKREIPFNCPGVVEAITDAGRYRVRYLYYSSTLRKTVIEKRLEVRDHAMHPSKVDPKK